MKSLVEYTTLRYHKTLNPKIWDSNGIIGDSVRRKLTEIANEWMKFASIPSEAVKDIVFTGGNANFNYTDLSDIDLHIMVDMKKLPSALAADEEFTSDYFFDKKAMWANRHDIKIKGYPVELYAQIDNEDLPVNQGSFSISTNKWITKPTYIEGIDFENDRYVQNKVDYLTKQIDDVVLQGKPVETALELKVKIVSMRGESIKKYGEFATNNLVFKELRNRGYVDRINNYITQMGDKKLSLQESY